MGKMKGLLLKYMKSDWQSDDFGRGKSKTSKKRHRKVIKKRGFAKFKKDLE